MHLIHLNVARVVVPQINGYLSVIGTIIDNAYHTYCIE